MKERVMYVECSINGVYGWNKGYESEEKEQKWNEFWEKLDLQRPIFWGYASPKRSYDCGTLYTTEGSLYLHPMRFQGVLRVIVGCSVLRPDGTKEETFSAYEELKSLMEKCSQYVGFTYRLTRSNPIEVEFGNVG